MAKIRLDRDGNGPIPESYQLVTTEVEFLQLATENQPLHIRGERLCTWAEAFFSARKISCQEAPSYLKEFQTLLPALQPGQISALIALFGDKVEDLQRPLTIETVLNAVAPNPLWSASPSLSHFAEWLVWLNGAEEVEIIAPLLDSLILHWQMEDLPFDPQLYSIRTSEKARGAIKAWLGITDRQSFPVRQKFPLDQVPPPYVSIARTEWSEQIIQSKGNRFQELSLQEIPFSLKQVAAEEAFQYYLHNQNDLTTARLASLTPYLNRKSITALQKILPPPVPSALPADPAGIVSWYTKEYLPYREWQRSSGSDEGLEVSMRAARQFELWYLENYPRGINGSKLHSWLSFNKINQINCPENCLTLVIVLDGMHVSDSRTLLQGILNQTQRLSVTSQEYAFAPIPTVTEFAKDALFKGVPPSLAPDHDAIGKVLPEKQSPALRLKDAKPGKIYIWRVLEPDETYHHKNTSENLLQDVEGRLEAEALKIKEIVESIPDKVILQIILTTDHGRLLSETHKTIEVPDNMESHGRAAWGKSSYPYGTDTFIVQDDIAYLMGDSYGMSSDVAIPLDEGAFKDNKNRSGSELFPHGGIFPEEVILPWIVLARDVVQPEATIIINGNGSARRDGVFNITMVNKSDIELTLTRVILTLRTGATIPLDVDLNVPARSPHQIDIPYNPWPSAGDTESVQATARVRLPNKMVFEYPVVAQVVSKDIYIRPKDNILEDLD